MKKTIRCFAFAGKWPGRGASGWPAVRRGGDRELAIEAQPAGRGEGRGAAEQRTGGSAVRSAMRSDSPVGRRSDRINPRRGTRSRRAGPGPGRTRPRLGRRSAGTPSSARLALVTRQERVGPLRVPSSRRRPAERLEVGQAEPRRGVGLGGEQPAGEPRAPGRGRTGCSAGRGPEARRWSRRARRSSRSCRAR